MRISTSMMFDMGVSRLTDLQSNLVKTQQQISTGRRVLTPSDDPVAAAAALGVSQSISMNDQYAVNRNNAKSALSDEESNLANVVTQLQSVKTIIVGAGNGSLDDTQRQDYVTQLKSIYDELLGVANTKDSLGNYMFSGYQTDTQPFTKSATGATYNGDQGQRLLQVAPSRQISVSDSGLAVFENNSVGNGHFVTAAGASNTGSGIISTGSVADLSQLNGQSYSLTFSVDPTTGATTYTYTDSSVVPPTPSAPQPYTDGSTITLGGTQFSISGKPANGDTFSVQPSTDQSIFTTITNLITALSSTAVGSTNQTRLGNNLNTANNAIDNALNNISSVRASVGARLSELDDLDTAGSDLKTQYTDKLGDLVNIDPIEAYSSLTQQQYTLQAAQQSFISISGLSLFNYLK
ncbi:MAG TPA: flagellar hook-associated protein FlgL [Oxalicibacterium sp.]|jgi:flagellar hook-associated protein 3 FlgL|nr:flagellar hook-associated protein FlgL [Oxalicibacterium sp.]